MRRGLKVGDKEERLESGRGALGINICLLGHQAASDFMASNLGSHDRYNCLYKNSIRENWAYYYSLNLLKNVRGKHFLPMIFCTCK